MNPKKENIFFNLGFNIIFPVIILNRGPDFISSESAPVYVLFIALAFPFFYGLKDFITIKKINTVSVIGLVSIALTGGLALLQLEGIYFAIKEAGIPLILAFFALGSIAFKKPLASLFIFKSSLFDTELITAKLRENNKEKFFKKLMNTSTLVLSGSFVLSAVLNFVIALFVFKDIDPDMEEHLKRQLINEQVADMTWMGYVFIALPLTVITGFFAVVDIKTTQVSNRLKFGRVNSSSKKRFHLVVSKKFYLFLKKPVLYRSGLRFALYLSFPLYLFNFPPEG